MKILFVTPRFPYPLLKGDQAVVYNRLRILSKYHEITLLTFYESEDELIGLSALRSFCKEIHIVKLDKLQSIINIATLGISSNIPLQVAYYRSCEFKRKFDVLTQNNAFDIIHAFMLRMAPYLDACLVPKVLELIDSMQLNLQRRIVLEPFFIQLLFREEFRRISKYEKNIGKVANYLVVVSENDKEFIDSNNVGVVQNGVDTAVFSPCIDKRKKSHIVFSGNMGYAPNVHAVKWFVERCFPYIRQRYKQAVLIIAGGNLSAEIKKLKGHDGIIVTGYVSSMPDILNQCSVAIAPMRSGSGMQNKILEAMACGLPIVTTTLGLGSIKATPGKDILIADDPEEFGENVLKLIKDNELAKKIGIQGSEFVKRNHSWEKVDKKLIKFIN
jgi:sugar transferase (PEP-CTERM/EpsH1 system associated)